MYADDTVLFYGDKDSTAIQDVLTNEADRVASWIRENSLALNLKKGKTEFVLYGSHQKLSRMTKCEITINNGVINESSAYCYLGVTLASHLTLQEHFNNIYRKCSTRVKLQPRSQGFLLYGGSGTRRESPGKRWSCDSKNSGHYVIFCQSVRGAHENFIQIWQRQV